MCPSRASWPALPGPRGDFQFLPAGSLLPASSWSAPAQERAPGLPHLPRLQGPPRSPPPCGAHPACLAIPALPCPRTEARLLALCPRALPLWRSVSVPNTTDDGNSQRRQEGPSSLSQRTWLPTGHTWASGGAGALAGHPLNAPPHHLTIRRPTWGCHCPLCPFSLLL